MVQAPTAPVKTSIKQEGGSLPYALQLVLLLLIAVIPGKGKSFLQSPLGHMPATEPIIDTDIQTPEAGLVNHDGLSGAGRGSYSSSPGNTEDEHRNDLGSAVTKEEGRRGWWRKALLSAGISLG